jgi:hypothetical protein
LITITITKATQKTDKNLKKIPVRPRNPYKSLKKSQKELLKTQKQTLQKFRTKPATTFKPRKQTLFSTSICEFFCFASFVSLSLFCRFFVED